MHDDLICFRSSQPPHQEKLLPHFLMENLEKIHGRIEPCKLLFPSNNTLRLDNFDALNEGGMVPLRFEVKSSSFRLIIELRVARDLNKCPVMALLLAEIDCKSFIMLISKANSPKSWLSFRLMVSRIYSSKTKL